MSRATKADLYRAEREKGMTYREIAEKHGVTFQRVAQACGKTNPSHFAFVTEKGCIYAGLRNWMNENKVSKAELLRRMGYEAVGQNLANLRGWLRGTDARKSIIDKLIEVTGLPYEELFKVEGEVC